MAYLHTCADTPDLQDRDFPSVYLKNLDWLQITFVDEFIFLNFLAFQLLHHKKIYLLFYYLSYLLEKIGWIVFHYHPEK